MNPAPAATARASAWRRLTRSGLALYAALCSAMLFLLFLYYIAKSKAFAFVDIGSDTFYCFYPLQLAVAQQLQTMHSITWSFQLGLGGFLGTLFDPFWLVFGWLPESWQLGLRAPMYALHLLLAGACFYAYLRQIDFRRIHAVSGGLAYAFCSYALVNAQWEVAHGTEYLQFALYLFLFERYLQRGSRWCAVAAGVAIGLGHPLGIYMFGLFSVTYVLARRLLSADRAWSALLRQGFVFALWFAIGLAVTAPLLLPALYYFIESPRVTGAHSAAQHVFEAIFTLQDHMVLKAEIGAVLGKDLMGAGKSYVGWGNYFESPGFYVGLLPLILLPQLLGPHATPRERRLAWVGIVGTAVYMVWPGLRFAVYGFGHFGFRFSTLWISALLLVMGLLGWRRMERSGVWKPGIVLGAGGVLGIVGMTVIFLPAIVNLEHVLRVVGFTALYVAAVALLLPRLGARAAPVLLALCACELLLFAVPPMINRDAANSDGASIAGRYHDGTAAALALARADEHSGAFYRIEKNFDSVFLDDPLAQHYFGTQSYYFHATPITRFVDGMGLLRQTPSPNYISQMTARRDIIDLLGVKYLIARDRGFDRVRDMHYIGRAGNLEVYRNETAHAFGTFYDRIEGEDATDRLLPEQRDRFLLSNVVALYPDAVRARLAALAASDAPQPALAPATDIKLLRDDALAGEVTTPAAKVLLLATPYDRGWHATLDGRPLDVFEADYGLTAALVPAGKHTFTLTFAPLGRRVGWWVSAAALAVLAVIGWRARRAQRATPNAGSATNTNEPAEASSDAASNSLNGTRGSARSA